MALRSIHPAIQHLLVALQAAGAPPEAALPDTLDHCGVPPTGSGDAPLSSLRALLLAHSDPAAVLAAAANASGLPCPLGALLAQLLSCSILHSSQLLAAEPAVDWAATTASLHAVANSGTLPQAARTAAQQALGILVKALLTSGSGAEQQQAERALQQLRLAWAAPTAPSSSADGVALLAAVVGIADQDVFPRQRARSWLEAELGRVLLPADGDSPPNTQHNQQEQLPAEAEADGAASWGAAMAAFAAALPTEVVLQQVQVAVWQGAVHLIRAAALLVAAAALEQGGGAAIELWMQQQVAEALQQRAGNALRSLLLLQREMLPRLKPSQQRQQVGAAQRGQPVQALPSQQRQYGSWFGNVVLAPQHQGHLQFLLQQLLIPMLPEDGACWVAAQVEVLAVLLRQVRQQQQQLLPASSMQLVEEHLNLAKQRLRAEQQHEQQRGGGGGCGSSCLPGAPASNLEKGREIVSGLLNEFVVYGGQLRAATLNSIQAKAANVFTRGELHNMLVPALLEPCGDHEYLFAELGKRGDAQIWHHFRAEAVQQYRRLCLQAQLEGATLQQLADRAPDLLLAPAESGGGDGSPGISGHKLLDRVGQLIGEQLQRWQQQQQHVRGPSSRSAAARAAAAPPRLDQLVSVLLSTWTATYRTSLGSGGASMAAVAAHVLSIAHQHPVLHSPLLRRLRQALLLRQSQQQTGERELEAAAMLATTAGALVLQPAQQQQQQRSGAATASTASLQPLFVWHQQQQGARSDNGSGTEPAEVPGPVWLQQLLSGLPLGGGMAHAGRIAAAHLRCLHHFQHRALLPGSTSISDDSSTSSPTLLLHWRQPAAAALSAACPDYGGEFAVSLVFPACPAALRLQQWLLLRLSVAQQLLGWDLGSYTSSPAGLEEGRAAAAQQLLQGCLASLQSECAPLVTSAGKLPLFDFLRLEAAAAVASGGGDLLPLGTSDAAFRLCCALYLGSPSPAGMSGGGGAQGQPQTPPLRSLVEPIAAAGSTAAHAACPAAAAAKRSPELQLIPDTDEEEEAWTGMDLEAAAAPPAAVGRSAILDGLAAAVSAALALAHAAETEQQKQQQEEAAAMVVCQRACAHLLRLLAVPQEPGSSLPKLLPALLSSLVQCCKQHLAVEAAPGRQGQQWGQRQVQPLPLRCADQQQAQQMAHKVVGLASGLLLELVPLPLGSMVEQGRQRRQLAAAVCWGLWEAGGMGVSLLGRLEAALIE